MKRANPLKLNTLQLKTLVILQELARHKETSRPAPETASAGEGAVIISQFPHAHGNHFHVGDYVVAGADANGLRLEPVWVVLQRKGLAKSYFPQAIVLTKDGIEYETGIKDQVLHSAGH
ncbi:MAG: hypothetical protein AB7G15_18905 [Alphaproteobacteria bacterium]